MSRVVKRSASQAIKSTRSHRGIPLPAFIPPQLSQPVEKPPAGPQWVHEIKLDGFRVAARIDNGRVQLLTRTGLDWTGIDGELCGIDEAGLPSFAQTQAATDGERGRASSIMPSICCTWTGGTFRPCRLSSARPCSSR